MSGNPIEELGMLMNSQMKNIMKRNTGITLELGTINNDMGLSVASLGNAIPKGDYMVSLHLSQESLEIETSTEEEHEHVVSLPANLRGLQAGDRVIVAWVGTEPIVVDVVVSS